MIAFLLQKIQVLGSWSYLLIFLSALLESAAFFGLLVPGETIVIFSGYLASQGILELDDCLWVIALGAMIGDSIGYEMGKRLDRTYFEHHKRLLFLRKEHLKRAENYFERHGGKTVFLGRFIGFLRAFAPFVAGMSRMPYNVFLTFNVLGGVLWTICFTLLGYYFGHSWKVIESWAGKIGLLLFLAILLVGAFIYLFKELTKQKAALLDRAERVWKRFCEQPRVKVFIKSHPKLIFFLKERLSPKHYLGIHLTIGLLISAVFVRIFSEIVENILEHGLLERFDQWVYGRTAYLQSPLINDVMRSITFLGDKITISVATFFLTLFFILRRKLADAITVLAAVIGGSLLSQIVKLTIQRPRPLAEHALIEANGFSFPSGHSMMSAIFYGLLSYYILRGVGHERTRITASAILLALVVLIGLSRIYLQVHYLSDVLAGFTGGLFYLALCLTGLEVYRRKYGVSPSDHTKDFKNETL